jgi:hypothetical protein
VVTTTGATATLRPEPTGTAEVKAAVTTLTFFVVGVSTGAGPAGTGTKLDRQVSCTLPSEAVALTSTATPGRAWAMGKPTPTDPEAPIWAWWTLRVLA